MKIVYTLTPKSRISPGRRAQVQNVREIHEVIPGSVVRGALGTAWWGSPDSRFEPENQAVFDELFARGMDVMAAIPRSGSDAGVREAAFTPFSWVRCKYLPTAECSSQWHDQAVALLSGSSEWSSTCPACRRPVEPAKRGWNVPDEWSVSPVRTALINGAALDEALFTRPAIVKDVLFRGTIQLADSVDPDAIAWLLADKTIWVGGQKSTMGACRWSAEVVEVAAPGISGACTVQLLAPAIIVDEFGAPSLDLEGAIRSVLPVDSPATVTKTWTRPETVAGWHGVAGLPKPTEWALAAGSTALVEGVGAADVGAISAGLGLRRAEGFRPVRIVAMTASMPIEVAADAADSRRRAPVAVQTASPGLLDPLMDMLSGSYRQRTLQALQTEARAISTMRADSAEAFLITGRLNGLPNKAWMKELSADVQDQILRLLALDDLRVVHHELDRAIEEEMKP